MPVGYKQPDVETYREAARRRYGNESVGPWSTVQVVDGGAYVDVTVFVADADLEAGLAPEEWHCALCGERCVAQCEVCGTAR